MGALLPKPLLASGNWKPFLNSRIVIKSNAYDHILKVNLSWSTTRVKFCQLIALICDSNFNLIRQNLNLSI